MRTYTYPTRDCLPMPLLSRRLLAAACRIYLDVAYPEGAQSIPEKKRAYGQMGVDARIEDYLPPAPRAEGIGQKLAPDSYSFRLGSSHYPNLKMKVQCISELGVCRCIFSVDTHDAYAPERAQPPADHPDAPAWRALQMANNALKAKIESAWDRAGILTHNRLLREELAGTLPVFDPPSPLPEPVRK